jgi:uncharacterized protein
MHAVTNQSVDMMLAMILILGGAFGAQIGTRVGHLLKPVQLRILLAVLVLSVCGKLALDLLIQPSERYSASVVASR